MPACNRRAITAAAILFFISPISGWGLNVVINNQNASFTAPQVYFSFKDAAVTGTINGQPIVRDQSYSLADIGTGINLQSFSGGRLYFSLGAPLTGTGDPEPINSSVANWGTRFDKMELTYSQTDHSGVADLTSIDFFAIPIAIKTYAGNAAAGTPSVTLTYDQPGNTIISHLAALSDNDSKVLLHDAQGNFLRVLGPTLAHVGAYPSFQPYISAVQSAGQTTRIVGLYSHLPAGPSTTTQNYNFAATFDADGNLRLDGGGTSYAGGATVGPGHEIFIAAADLAPGIYSANPPYTVDGAAADIGDNDVYSAVVRDILTGYALGFVDSATVDPNTGIAFKDETSDHWWASTQAFGYLQRNSTYYDQYAAYLQTISNAYGYPFSDRWQTVQASLDPQSVGTMELDVLPDAAAATPVINSAATAAGTMGLAFTYKITATNNPTSFGFQGNANGLTINAKTGLISGTPKMSGKFSYTLNAYNAAGKGSTTLAVAIQAAAPVITSATTAAGTVGKAFTYRITATNSPASFGFQGNANGLTIDSKTGLISGIPKAAGTFSYTLNAYNGTGKGSGTLTVTVTK